MFERYHRELLNFITRTVGDRDRAADVVQEAFARVLALQARPAALAAVVHEPRALLYRTARNIVIDEHRRRMVRGPGGAAACDDDALSLLPAPQAGQPDELLASRQDARRVLAAIQALPPRCREAFVLFKLEGLPQAEIAQRMGITRNAVEKHVINGMVACRRSLEAPSAASPDLTSGLP